MGRREKALQRTLDEIEKKLANSGMNSKVPDGDIGKKAKSDVPTIQGTIKKKRKISPLLIVAFLFIFGGIVVLIYPIVGNFVANQQRTTAVARYDNTLAKMNKKERAAAWKQAEEYNVDIYEQQNGQPISYLGLNYKKLVNSSGVMGTLDIPAIGITKMPFYHGTNEFVLNEGVGHYQPSSIPIGGKNTRAVIAGHSGIQNQVLFSDINSLKVGDIFYINILGKRHAYKIFSFDEISPNQVDKVKINKGKDEVTLLTCTPPGINTYRLLVNGKRIPYAEAIKETVYRRDIFSYTHVVIASIIAAFLLFFILYLIYRYLRKKYRQTEDEQEKDKIRRKIARLFTITKAFFVLLIVGVIIILTFAIYGYSQIQTQNSMGKINIGQKYELSNYNLDKERTAKNTEVDVSSVTTGTFAATKINFNQAVNDWGIGKLVIPSQGINLPILAGLNNENLLTGAATLNSNEQMGMGNYVLLAHNIIGQTESKDVLFHRISNLKNGDLIYASDFKNVYTYKVTTNEVVKDTEVSVIEQPKFSDTKPYITLIRCEGNYLGTPYRRVVQATLSSRSPVNGSNTRALGFIQGENTKGKVYSGDAYPFFIAFCMELAAAILQNPLQTAIPFFLLLVIPILFLNLI